MGMEKIKSEFEGGNYEEKNHENEEVGIEDNLSEEGDDEIILFQYSITSYGADYPVDGLIKRLDNKDIIIPDFQRGYVWNQKQASRFIESLLLGLPVPGIFLSKEPLTNKLLVIDGQQRLSSLSFFYQGIFGKTGKEFILKGVQNNFEGHSYRLLSDSSRRTLDDSIIHATVVSQDQPTDDNSSIYYVFERLNTGGTFLQPQEIRSCIYHGEFKNTLNEMIENFAWREIYGLKNKRMREQELILRFLALFFQYKNYKKPMKEFLNKFMSKNRDLKNKRKDDFKELFFSTIEFIHKHIGINAFKPKKLINAAVFDAVMVGLANRLVRGPINNLDGVKTAYNDLINNEKFIKFIGRGTANVDSIQFRINTAIEIFCKLH